jgi:hypothetical protein
MSKVRVFGSDHRWQVMTSRPADEWDSISEELREEIQKGRDITIVLGPFGDRDPFDFPYIIKSDLYREPPTGGEA